MTPMVEFRNVGKTYVSARKGDTVEALAGSTSGSCAANSSERRRIDFALRRGEFLTIVGPSGCGKSTLLSLVAGFDAPTSGEVLFDGRPVTAPAPERGVMFQDYALFPWRTVAGNVEFGPRARGADAARTRERVRELIQMVGLEGFEHRYPHELSGGMRQRCALARMLANDPTMWLMDEPLAAVDLQTRIILQDELLRLWGDGGEAGRERPTVVFVTHGIDEAVLLADRVIVLGRRPGRIKEVVDVALPRPRSAMRNTPRGRAPYRPGLPGADPRRGRAGHHRRVALNPSDLARSDARRTHDHDRPQDVRQGRGLAARAADVPREPGSRAGAKLTMGVGLAQEPGALVLRIQQEKLLDKAAQELGLAGIDAEYLTFPVLLRMLQGIAAGQLQFGTLGSTRIDAVHPRADAPDPACRSRSSAGATRSRCRCRRARRSTTSTTSRARPS